MIYKEKCIYGEYSIHRPVTIQDADFIVSIRTNPQLSQFISETNISIQKQKDWICDYQKRNKNETEHYFISCDLNGVPWGTVRIYNIDANDSTGGSWVIKLGAPLGVTLESYLVPLFFAFEILRHRRQHIDVRKKNKKVLKWHELCGAKFIREDNLDRYYYYDAEAYAFARAKVKKILSL